MTLSRKAQNYIWFGFVTAVVVALYFVGITWGFFYGFWWYDTVLHVLGGIAIGFWGLALFPGRPLKTVSLALGIGVLWEVFERLGHLVLPRYLGYGPLGDTLLDIACAILGASMVLVFFNDHE